MWLEDGSNRFKKFTVEINDIDGSTNLFDPCFHSNFLADDEYAHLRPTMYGSETDIYILCFSLNSRTSFEAIANKWVPEITRHHASQSKSKGAPSFFVVGLKRDLRESMKEEWARGSVSSFQSLSNNNDGTTTSWTPFIDTPEGYQLAKQIKALGYIECSSLGGLSEEDERHRSLSQLQSPSAYANDGPMSVYLAFETAFSEIKKKIPAKVLLKRRQEALDFAKDVDMVSANKFVDFFKPHPDNQTKPKRLLRRHATTSSIKQKSSVKPCGIQ